MVWQLGGSTFVEWGLGVLPTGGTGSTPLKVQGSKPLPKTSFSNFNIKFGALHAFNLIKLQEPDRRMNVGMNEWTYMFKKHESEVHAFASVRVGVPGTQLYKLTSIAHHTVPLRQLSFLSDETLIQTLTSGLKTQLRLSMVLYTADGWLGVVGLVSAERSSLQGFETLCNSVLHSSQKLCTTDYGKTLK